MQRIQRTALVVCGLLLCSLPASAADNPLGAIPQDAGVVIRWQKPTETVKKAAEFVNQVDPDAGRMVTQLSFGIGVAISNPGMTGLDKERDWYVAVFPKAEGDPGIVFAIPATDSDAMQEAVTGEFEFATHEDWLLYSQEKELIEKVQAQIAGDEKSISARIDKESTSVMDRNDLSIFLNVPRLREVYKDQLEKAEEDFDAQLEQFQNLPTAAPGIDMKPMMEMYSKAFRGLLQAVKDTEGVAVGLLVNEAGLNLETQSRVAADSATDKVLKAQKKSDMQKLSALPDGSHAYFGASGDINGLVNLGTQMSAAMYQSDDAEKKAAFEKVSADMAKLDFGSYAMSFGVADAEGGIMRIANVIQVDPAEKMRDLSRQMVESMGSMEIGGVKQEIELKADAETYGERKADVVVTKQQVDPEADPLGIQSQMQRIMFGEEGQVQRIVYTKDSVVQTVGGGRAAMESLLKSVDAGTAATGDGAGENGAPLAAARSQLPPQTNLLGLIDLPLTLTDLLKGVLDATQLPVPIDADALKQSLGDKRSYLGFSFAGSPQTAHMKLHVPVLQAKNMTKLVKEVREMVGQPQL